MTAQEMIDKLSTIPPETEVYWEDAIEGNDCEVGSIYMNKWSPSTGATNEEFAYISPNIPTSKLVRIL